MDVLFGLLEFGVAVDASDAGLGDPLAVDVVGFDFSLEVVPVGELEVANLWVVGVFEEDGLAVSSVLRIVLVQVLVCE